MIEVKIENQKVLNEIKRRSKVYADNIKINYYQITEKRPEYKIRYNHYCGKVAEFIASIFIKKQFHFDHIVLPDCKIYDCDDERIHNADLVYGNNLYHIKCCTPETEKYGISWCFQLHSDLVSDPENHSDNNVVFMFADVNRDIYKTKGIFRWGDICDKLKPPKLSCIRNKRFIYATDI